MNKFNINSYDRATQAAIIKQVKTKRPKKQTNKTNHQNNKQIYQKSHKATN